MPFGLRRGGKTEETLLNGLPEPAGEAASARPPIELIVGLGNPGAAYAGNRHNVGFWVINRLSKRLGIPVEKHNRTASVGEGAFEGRRLVLAKPRTFMNDSGNAIRELLRKYKLPAGRMLLIYDELDLPVARVRVRETGGSGGQKGMKSILAAAGTQDFPRIRIGIGRPVVGDKPSWDPEHVAGWVLGNAPAEQRRLLEAAADTAADAAICCLKEGVQAAMNRFNRD
ncbi:MAG TPA: aminoacyl-tRNA hydrolase [Dehalococcoidia bacterium]|nr:aminoacyl-tRNA hydrolase [Dehalococcoidia bacterium]